MEEGDYSGKDGGVNIEGSSYNGSSASGVSTTGSNECSVVGMDRTSGKVEDGGVWRQLKQRRGRRGGRKVRARREGGGGFIKQETKTAPQHGRNLTWATATAPTRCGASE